VYRAQSKPEPASSSGAPCSTMTQPATTTTTTTGAVSGAVSGAGEGARSLVAAAPAPPSPACSYKGLRLLHSGLLDKHVDSHSVDRSRSPIGAVGVGEREPSGEGLDSQVTSRHVTTVSGGRAPPPPCEIHHITSHHTLCVCVAYRTGRVCVYTVTPPAECALCVHMHCMAPHSAHNVSYLQGE
jgi:hypothetical protein